jgi:nitronate monooxygenase
MASETVERLNELLLAERAGVEVGAALKQSVPKGYFRNHIAKIEADEAVSCAVIERGIRALGGEPAAGKNDFAEKLAAVPTLEGKLDLLARGQAWVVKRVDALLAEPLPDEVLAELREMRREHVENIDWCNEQVAELRAAS